MTTKVALPGGGNAHDTWASLSRSQRTVLEVAAGVEDYTRLPLAQARTLEALARRGITDRRSPRNLTERGAALVRWRHSPEGEEWVQEWTGQHQ